MNQSLEPRWIIQVFFLECYDDDIKLLGRQLTWKERLAKRKHVCDDQRRLPVECMKGMECEKGGLKTIKVEDNFDGIEDIKGDLEGVHDIAGKFGQPGRSSLHSRRLRKSSRHSRQHSEATAASFADVPMEDKKKVRKTPDVFASTWGDTFKLGKLIELANVDLDKHYNMDSMSARMSGTIIEVEATYENLRHFLSSFGLSQVRYTYRVRERMLPYISRESLHPSQPEDYPKSRRYIVQHGILLDFKVGGEFGFFSIVYLLIMLTTSLALLATAHKLADFWALYLHRRKENYFHIKYDVSADFSEMWKCPDCGYYNLQTDETCRGLEKWTSPHDARTNHCGARRGHGAHRDKTAPL